MFEECLEVFEKQLQKKVKVLFLMNIYRLTALILL